MELTRIRALRGPNLWSRHTAIETRNHETIIVPNSSTAATGVSSGLVAVPLAIAVKKPALT